jgi:proline iminopeptidase
MDMKQQYGILLILNILLLFLITGCKMNTSQHIEDGYADVNGINLYYKIIGKGDPVVILHGGPGFDHNSIIQFKELADDYRVIFYDQRASGNSSGAADSASITVNNFVEDLEGLRRHLKLGKINVIGFSWGATLAMCYAIKYHDNIKSLVIVSTGGGSKDYFNEYFNTLKERTLEEDRKIMGEIEQSESFKNQETKIVQEYWRLIMKPFFKDKSLVNQVDMTFGKNTTKNQAAIGKFLMDDLGDYDIHNELEVIDCSTLIVYGTYDAFPCEGAYKVYKHIPSSKLVIFEDAGHFMYIDAHDRFFPLIRRFLKGDTSVETSIPDSLKGKLDIVDLN